MTRNTRSLSATAELLVQLSRSGYTKGHTLKLNRKKTDAQ